MAKNEQMLRLKFIEELLRRRKDKGATYQEITDFLEEKFEEKGLSNKLKFTERTFQRDKLAIADVFGISISYSRKRNVHFIEEEELELSQESIFDQLLLVQAYRETQGKTGIMFSSREKPEVLNISTELYTPLPTKKSLNLITKNSGKARNLKKW